VEVRILVVRAFVRLREVLDSTPNSPGSRQIDFAADTEKQTTVSGDHSDFRLDWSQART
jgi:hypothetical protein